MDRQVILAIALSALIVLGYQEYLRIYYPETQKKPVPSAGSGPSDVPSPAAATASTAPGAADLGAGSDRPKSAAAMSADVTIQTPSLRAALSTVGGRLLHLQLHDYRTTVDPSSPPLEIVNFGEDGDAPLGLMLRGTPPAPPWSDEQLVYKPSQTELVVPPGGSAEVRLSAVTPDGVEIEKSFRFDAKGFGFEVGVKVVDPQHRYSEVGLRWTHRPTPIQSRYAFHGPEALVGGKLLHFSDDELKQGKIFPDASTARDQAPPIHWAGYADSYFLSAIAPRENDPARLWVKKESAEITSEVLIPATAAEKSYPFTIYTGPKDLHALEAVGHHLTRTVDLGWFGFVAEPMLHVLKLFHTATRNYGIDIILLTVLVKLVTVPLTQKSYKSMQEMQKLQPQMKRLQEKYADDREALNREVMELYRRHNVNPLGGCLPMLVQMPIFIGLYNALLSAVELRHAAFLGWMNDLSAPDRLPPLTQAPFATVAGVEVRIPVLTLLMGASMLIQQRMTPQMGDPVQQRMMMIMPLVFTVMFINFPSGLALYWLVNNVLTIAQQVYVQRSRS